MIASSRVLKGSALVLAVATHGALALVATPDVTLEVEGASGAAHAKLGTSFADMAMGVMGVTETTETAEPVEPEEAEEQPKEAVEPETPDLVKPDLGEPAKAATITSEMAKKPELATPQQLVPQSAAPVVAMDAPSPQMAIHEPLAAPVMQAALPVLSTLTPVQAVNPLEPTPVAPAMAPLPKEVASPVEPQMVTAPKPETAAVSSSLRPRMRSREFETVHKPKPQPRAKPKPEPKPRATAPAKPEPASRGNSTVNARAGSSTGKAGATARSSGSDGKKDRAGNAAASNYPGKVVSYIKRRANVRGRGRANVTIRISANGQLSSVTSSNAKAAAAIRRLGRVPKPPAGAKRSFSFTLTWK
ncbi:hypothetical protein [Pelagimonas varians]|uniref:Gram-negative bacterial tonB protein n=1 Tax=Pelagimonas varians TaxID=696760 RepID=A0A238KEM4_9RHOB|nr:hypothetical protein [Pelagimonas varians]PYG32457.1 outer membrane transport energization protein TonB [Pelagimonas varians]SMX41271.1 hypothetical protein PEV8663_02224 [Pelagimonas varians]